MTSSIFQAKFLECEEKVETIVVLKVAAVVMMFMGGVAADHRATNNFP